MSCGGAGQGSACSTADHRPPRRSDSTKTRRRRGPESLPDCSVDDAGGPGAAHTLGELHHEHEGSSRATRCTDGIAVEHHEPLPRGALRGDDLDRLRATRRTHDGERRTAQAPLDGQGQVVRVRLRGATGCAASAPSASTAEGAVGARHRRPVAAVVDSLAQCPAPATSLVTPRRSGRVSGAVQRRRGGVGPCAGAGRVPHPCLDGVDGEEVARERCGIDEVGRLAAALVSWCAFSLLESTEKTRTAPRRAGTCGGRPRSGSCRGSQRSSSSVRTDRSASTSDGAARGRADRALALREMRGVR